MSGVWVVRAVAASFAAVMVAGCGTGSSKGSAGKANDSITVYSGQHEQTMAKLVGAFEKSARVQVKLRSGDEATLANQVLQEGGASPADVFVAENPPAMAVLDGRKLLAKVASSTLAAMPSLYNPTSGDWVAVSARTAVMVYNQDKLAAGSLPTSLLDLAGPTWKGKVGFAPTETDFQPLVATIIKTNGEAAARTWIDGLKMNGKVYDSNESLVAAVNRGEVATGLIDHYYWYRLRDEVGPSVRAALHSFSPGDPGNLVDVSGAAILKSSRHHAAAQRFLAFLVSKPAQTIIATSESWEYPLAAGVTNTRLEVQLNQLRPPAVSIGDLGDGTQSLKLLQEAGLL